MIIHGDRKNKRKGGTCAEFFTLNNRTECCTSRDDDCFIINFDSTCYCDIFCYSEFKDCCSDFEATCNDSFKNQKTEITIQNIDNDSINLGKKLSL